MLKLKDALILTGITLIAGLLLGGAYELTKEPIARQKIAANAKSYQAVSPGAVEFKADETLNDKIKEVEQLMADSGLNLGKVTIDEALYAYDERGSLKGMVVITTSGDGYGGDIQVVTGIQESGTEKKVTGIDFLQINETPGLGMKAVEDPFKNQFKDKSAESFDDTSIEAISGATFTSKAVFDAVNAAVYFARETVDWEQGGGQQ